MQMTVTQYFERARCDFGLGSTVDKLEHDAEGRRHARWDIEFEGQHREFLLSPYIKEGDITFLYAAKGVGKTCLALPMAYAVAEGRELFGFLKASKKHTVLYADGEMGESALALRKESTRRQFSLPRGKKTSLWLLSGRFNLYDPVDRMFFEDEIEDINKESPDDMKLSLIVLDNLTSMIGAHDKPEEWDKFFDWAKTLLNKGISLLIIYHSNRDGMMRGSQMKTINADNLIYLEDPRICGEDAPKAKKGKKVSKVDKLPQDRKIIAIRLIPENLRNNEYPEAYIPIEIEYSVIDPQWRMLNLEDHRVRVLRAQAKHLTDQGMAPFWGVSARQVKEMRRKYNIAKNTGCSSCQDTEDDEQDFDEDGDMEEEG